MRSPSTSASSSSNGAPGPRSWASIVGVLMPGARYPARRPPQFGRPVASPAMTGAGQRVEFGIYVPQLGFDYPQIRERADACEALGFHSIWFFEDRKSTRLNSSHQIISYAVFCLKK